MARNDDVLDGLYPAIVTSNKDPLDMGRVKVRFPWLDDEEQSHWARLVQPYAGNERGLFFMPEVGDEVLVAFELGDVHQPLVIGATWNGEDEPPEPGDPDGSNHHKIIETRSGHKLHFDDTPGAESIQLNDSSLNNILRWDSAENSLTITAKTGDIHVEAPQGTISLLAKDVVMTASNNASRTVGGDEKTTVGKDAIEACGTSKTWTASSKLTGTAKVVSLSASGSMSVGGGSASVKTTQQKESKIVVQGPTQDTCGKLDLKADFVYEKADVRTWTIADAKLHAPQVSLDASAAVTVQAGMFDVKAKASFSMLGETVILQAGNVTVKSGQVSFNSKTEPPPGPGISNKLAVKAFRGGMKVGGI